MKTNRLWLFYLVTHLLPETRFFGFKVRFLRWCGANIGSNVRISSSARFYGGGRLIIGDDVWIGSGNVIHAISGATVRIGSCCDFGPQVLILTGSHMIDSRGTHIAGTGFVASVEIGDGCWLGARSMILPGVKLMGKTLVAAGSVVTQSPKEEQTMIAGVPAHFKRKIV